MVLVCGNVKMNSCVNLVHQFNNAVRKVLGYGRFDLFRSILRGFCMLPLDFYIDRMRLLLFYDWLKSERSVVIVV